MNILQGTVKKVVSSEHSSLAEIDVRGDSFFAVLLETSRTAVYLKEGSAVMLLFKETEVVVGKNIQGEISLLNRTVSTVRTVETGKVLSKVVMDHKGTVIAAVLPSKAVLAMSLREGVRVEWFVKANEITLQWSGK